MTRGLESVVRGGWPGVRGWTAGRLPLYAGCETEPAGQSLAPRAREESPDSTGQGGR